MMPEGNVPEAPVVQVARRSAAWHAGAFIIALLGLLLIAVPYVLSILTIPLQLEAAATGLAPEALPDGELMVEALLTAVVTLVMPGLGLLLISGYSAVPAPPGLALRVQAMVRSWHRIPVGEGVLSGLSITPALFLVVMMVGILVYGFTAAAGGTLPDETQNRFQNATLPTVIAIAIVAGLGEEFLYRGILQGSLSRVVGLPVAIVAQAVLFGVLHAGYGNWISPIVAGTFGLMWGVLAGRLGLVPLIVGHAVYDVVAISISGNGTQPFAWSLLGMLTVFSIAHTVVTRGALWKRILRGDEAPSQEPPAAVATPYPAVASYAASPASRAEALRVAGYGLCKQCSTYPVQPGSFSERTGYCQVCAYRWLAGPEAESNPRYAERIARAREECERILAEVEARAGGRYPPPPF
ncbi:MAG TPA: CPBP family intramembrane glutamic endopeptidase [Candidatus Thermoplasmatota archaeon]|nr:CPBP family intramembrane glutamic endopeptidase [Candidatus Thermoplasmatota archaeon]